LVIQKAESMSAVPRVKVASHLQPQQPRKVVEDDCDEDKPKASKASNKGEWETWLATFRDFMQSMYKLDIMLDDSARFMKLVRKYGACDNDKKQMRKLAFRIFQTLLDDDEKKDALVEDEGEKITQKQVVSKKENTRKRAAESASGGSEDDEEDMKPTKTNIKKRKPSAAAAQNDDDDHEVEQLVEKKQKKSKPEGMPLDWNQFVSLNKPLRDSKNAYTESGYVQNPKMIPTFAQYKKAELKNKSGAGKPGLDKGQQVKMLVEGYNDFLKTIKNYADARGFISTFEAFLENNEALKTTSKSAQQKLWKKYKICWGLLIGWEVLSSKTKSFFYEDKKLADEEEIEYVEEMQQKPKASSKKKAREEEDGGCGGCCDSDGSSQDSAVEDSSEEVIC